MGRVPFPHEGDLCGGGQCQWEPVKKSGEKTFIAPFNPWTTLFFSPVQEPGATGRGAGRVYKPGYRLEVHPYNIYYWRRMNRFAIYGPLTVGGREKKKISLTRRNIYVLLKDVRTDWQRSRQGLPVLLRSLPSDLPGHWSSLQPGCLSPFQPFSSLISTYHQPKGEKGRFQGREKNPNQPMYFQVITNWKSQFLCPDGRENEPSNTINSWALHLETLEEGTALKFNRSIL